MFEKIKFSLFNQRRLNEFLTISPCCAFMISLQDWGGRIREVRVEGCRGGHHMKSQGGILLFSKQVKEPASVYLTAVGFCVLEPQKPLNISIGRSMEGVLLFLFS